MKPGVWGVGRSNGFIQIFARPTLVAMVTKIGKFYQKIGYNQLVYEISRFLRQIGIFHFFGVCRFNCVSEICVTPTPVAMVTKILKFPHKNHNNAVFYVTG